MSTEITNHGLVIAVFQEIAENTYLKGDAKMMLGLIFGLSIKDGFCYASNEYLGKRLGMTPNAAQIQLFRLKEKGLVSITENAKKKRERKITLPNLEKFSQYTKKTLDALTPEQHEESLHVSVEEPPFVDKYAKFASPKKEPRITTIVNIGNVTLTPKMREYASKKDLNDQQTEETFEMFISHHGSKGSKFDNWDLAFNTWLLKAKKYDKKNFSDTRAKTSTSSSSKVGERIMMENMLREANDYFKTEMMRRGIFPYMILEKTATLPHEFSYLGITTISTLKGGVEKIWYDTRKYPKEQSCDDVITVDIIEHKGDLK